MVNGSCLFFVLALAFVCCAYHTDAQIYNLYRNLEELCNGNLTVDCPDSFNGRAGTFRFYLITRLSPGLCSVNVTLAENCGRTLEYYAFYFNFRKFFLPTNDRVRLYQITRYGTVNILKELRGSVSGYSDPASVAQAMTSYGKQPAFTFEYFRSASPASGSHEAFIDFVVVEDTYHAMNSRCAALSGYVNDHFICDTDGDTNRVNCPSSFSPSTTGYNPAYSRQCGNRPTTSYYTTTPYYWNTQGNYDYDYGLSSGAITGIVMGSVFFVVFLIAVISAACSASKKTSPSRPIVLTTTSGTALTSRPVVVGAPVPAAGPTPPFMSAPPSYEEVTASPAHVSVPMPQPPVPKF
ncbi:uncharacterized protein LOC129596486 [Paramacrobiotus metropolitanus]|uniref:uncharacterized protein LOC129596486 n=1 Tax=Paramacrobiotus metropolitanus TaxID=2943436 RepID=UPI002445DAA2|nr:uncharacterized protein LOC129596486 [Paramacrobiotus metropolitanus]